MIYTYPTITFFKIIRGFPSASLSASSSVRVWQQNSLYSERFPEQFMFQLSNKEYKFIRSQFVTLKIGQGQHRKYLPHVFTEQGVSMLSAVLKSDVAIEVSIKIIDSFVQMRYFLSQNAEIFTRLQRLEEYKEVWQSA